VSTEPPSKSAQALRIATIVAGPLVAVLLAFVPSALHTLPGFGSRPAYAAAIAVWMAIWWFTEAVPIAYTALIPLVAWPLTGVFGKGLAQDTVKSFEPFFDAYIFLFMGGMALGAAMEHWNLHRRIALNIMLFIGASARRLLWGVLLSTAFISMWISNTATAVMMVPIGLAVVHQLERAEGKKLKHFGAVLMLAVAYAANVGGIGTKIGTATNSIFAGFLSEKMNVEIGFVQYLGIGMPFVLIFLPVVWLFLWNHGRHDAPSSAAGRDVLAAELKSLGTMSSMERKVAWVFSTAALLWVLGDPLRAVIAPLLPFKLLGKHYEAAVAMSAAVVLAFARGLPLPALKRIPLSALLLLGGSFAMAAGIEGSGLSTWLSTQLEPMKQLPLGAQMLIATTATIALSAVASNTATVNLMLNLLPRSLPMLSSVALAASCDFALPAGTPPNAIVFGSGYIRLPVMMRIGIVLDVLAALILAGYGLWYLTWFL
jgi:sodium-dependent dicarboxylate transporter 2/3/5